MILDLDNLTDKEVQHLIQSLKKPSREFALQEINDKISTLFGHLDITETVVGSVDDIEYVLYLHRGNREPNRYSINLRFAHKYHQLIRLDIGSGHNNPDGTKIVGDHIHIYSNRYPKRDKYAYPLDIHEFPNIANIIDAFSKFTEYTNIKEII